MECKKIKQGDGVSLPEDITFDILSRLPVKPLCRFRCVSKGWRALISDPAFVAAQKSRAAPLIVGVFGSLFRSRCMIERLELRVLDTDGNVLRAFKDVSKLLAPTRLDLICVDRMRHGAMIIDPAAGRVVTVGGHDPSAGARRFTSLSHSSFGRAAPSGVYKVLRLHESAAADGRGELCEVATLGDGAAEPAWRQRPAPPFLTIWSCAGKATVNGVLYFMPRNAIGTPHGWNRIAAFDLESEEWMETIDGPAMGSRKNEERWTIALAQLKGTLSMVQNVWSRASPDGHYTNIWLLINSEKSIWVKEYMIQMPKHWILLKALDVLVDGRVLLLNAMKREEEQTPGALQYIVQYYDPGTGAFTDKMKMTQDFRGEMTLYTGSLLS